MAMGTMQAFPKDETGNQTELDVYICSCQRGRTYSSALKIRNIRNGGTGGSPTQISLYLADIPPAPVTLKATHRTL